MVLVINYVTINLLLVQKLQETKSPVKILVIELEAPVHVNLVTMKMVLITLLVEVNILKYIYKLFFLYYLQNAMILDVLHVQAPVHHVLNLVTQDVLNVILQVNVQVVPVKLVMFSIVPLEIAINALTNVKIVFHQVNYPLVQEDAWTIPEIVLKIVNAKMENIVVQLMVLVINPVTINMLLALKLQVIN